MGVKANRKHATYQLLLYAAFMEEQLLNIKKGCCEGSMLKGYTAKSELTRREWEVASKALESVERLLGGAKVNLKYADPDYIP